jgi:hypothetical protein
MKKLASICMYLLLGHAAYSQLIKGKIYDNQVQSTVPYASVYFSGTMVGTASDADGNFQLDITKYKSNPLIIRAIGYEAYTLKLIPGKDPYEIYLTPSLYEIEEVSVATKSLARKRKAYLRLFKSEFLGSTGNERNCEILNESDISFNYGSDKDVVQANASEPIVVYNGSLGYLITYYLDEFSYDKKRDLVTFRGDIVFKEDLALRDADKASLYLKRRELAYVGSCMHFFRALWADNLEANGFSVNRSSNEQSSDSFSAMYTVDEDVRYTDMVIQDNRNNKYLMYSENLAITHMSQGSRITFLKSKVVFEQNGFFDPSAIRWDGHMAQQRVADLLPYEYSLGN